METSRGTGAESVTVNGTGCRFDNSIPIREKEIFNIYFHFLSSGGRKARR